MGPDKIQKTMLVLLNSLILNINFELFFLKTPKTNKNIIDNEIKISGNTKLRLLILSIYKISVIHIY